MQTHTEKELVFGFPTSLPFEVFDQPGVPMPKGISPVDFIVDTGDRLVLVEVKDPSASRAPAKERAKFVKRMQTDELTHEELTPKARTTYCALHLMARDDRPVDYIVAIGIEQLSVQPLLLQQLGDRLRRRLKQELSTPWVRRYIDRCMVVDVFDLPRIVPGLTVQRIPQPRSTL